MSLVATRNLGSGLTHLSTKATLLPLLRGWQAAGITPLLFKGFYLAEFIYDDPGERDYGDVDLLLPPETSAAALEVAQQLGWQLLWERQESLYCHNHEEANLLHRGVFLELHRFILDTAAPWHSVQTRFTEAAWEASHELVWEGLSVRMLHPLDSMLMGVILARSWSGGDDWRLKRSDYRDLEMLSAKVGLAQTALEARARELRCPRTVSLFLERCNPWQGLNDPTPPNRFTKRYWQLVVMPERGHLGLERFLMSASRVPGTLLNGLRYLPTTAAPPEPQDVVIGGLPAKKPTIRRKERIVRGIKLASNLVIPWRADTCLRRSKALYAALARAGYPVRLERGPDADGKEHARILLEGFMTRDLEDVQTCKFEYLTEVHEANAISRVPASAVVDKLSRDFGASGKGKLAELHRRRFAEGKIGDDRSRDQCSRLDPGGDAVTRLRLTDDTVFAVTPGQVSADSGEETVILDPNSGRYFSLNLVGGDAWRMLEQPRRFAELKVALLERYEVAPELLDRDLRELLTHLLEAGLVVRHEAV